MVVIGLAESVVVLIFGIQLLTVMNYGLPFRLLGLLGKVEL